LSVVVHAANAHDTMTGQAPVGLALEKYPTVISVCADAGYRGTFVEIVTEDFGISCDISEKIKPKQWEILPKRWRVERTFAWLNNSRRLSKDYEFSTASEENFVRISHLHTLLKRF
jgi:transposase